MIIIGVDPGKTTGVCVSDLTNNKLTPVFSYEDDISAVQETIQKAERVFEDPVVVVVEDVVKTGRMNKDKFDQIVAFDRARTATKGEAVIIPPEATKKHKVKPPKIVKGRHARDAFRVIIAYLIREGKYEHITVDQG